MITYALAKELKGAGFVSNGQAWCEPLKEILPVPTLSELIAACGANGFSLGFGGIWRAVKEYGYENGRFLHAKADGETPEEAVARLFLALNKKP